MSSNFDFLKNIDKDLFNTIEDAQKLFRDEYFNQSNVQLRIFAEKMAKKILGEQNCINMTFDDVLNCLKDKIKTDYEKEFIDDLFFIKKQGNLSAHGEDITVSSTLEAFERAFEASISYALFTKKDKEVKDLKFDKTLLVTGKPQKEVKLVDKYIQQASIEKEQLLNSKQNEFNSSKKDEKESKNSQTINNIKKYKIKENIKKARKNLKQNINFKENKNQKTKPRKKDKKTNKKNKSKIIKLISFIIIVTISVFFLTKMLFFT